MCDKIRKMVVRISINVAGNIAMKFEMKINDAVAQRLALKNRQNRMLAETPKICLSAVT